MSENTNENALNSLLQEGAASYLDAVYALHRFTREVTNIAVTVFRARLPALVSAVGTKALPDNVVPYINPDIGSKDYNGNWAWITARIWLPEPWECNCHLGLSFARSASGTSTPYVTFMCQSTRVASFTKLKTIFRDKEHYYSEEAGKECGYCWILANPLSLPAEFEKMIDYLLAVTPSLAVVV